MIDWRWKRLFCVVKEGLRNEIEAKRATARLLRIGISKSWSRDFIQSVADGRTK